MPPSAKNGVRSRSPLTRRFARFSYIPSLRHALCNACVGALDVKVVVADMAVEDDCKTFVREAAKFSTQGDVIDLLVLNAGISMGAWVEDVEEKGLNLFRDIMNVNYLACVTCTHTALPFLYKAGKRRDCGDSG